MFYKKEYTLTAGGKLNINDEAASFVKIKFGSGTLTVAGYIEKSDGTTVSNNLNGINDNDYSASNSVTDTNYIYTYDVTGYDYIIPSVNCTVFLYTERY